MEELRSLAQQLLGAADEEQYTRIARDGDVDFVDIRFIDLPGRWHHVTVPVARLAPELFSKGIGFDGSSVAGFKTVERGDMVLLPDRSTTNIDDFGGHVVISMLATAAEADTRRPFPLDPRVVAGRAEEALRKSGHADESIWSPELEFYLFSGVSYDDSPSGAYYEVLSDEAGWLDPDGDEPELGYRIQRGGGYHAIPPLDMRFDVRNEIVSLMEEAGIPIKYHHHENGSPGQVEIEVLGEPLMTAADHLMLGKYIVRNTAFDWGLSATFMPKPLSQECGNGLHFHIRLLKNGKPVLHDEDGYAGLSEAAHHFIGGILTHGRALAAITNPSTNSYRRLRPGFEAPTNLFFSAANRSAAIRIPAYATEPATKTIEYRPSDATCNPYLTMSALLAAGIDGLNRKIDPAKHGFGPFDRNIHGLPKEERDKIVPLPETLGEALEELQADHDFLTAPGILPEEFVEIWCDIKRAESEEISTKPHPMEYNLYFDC